jgi:D-glycero-alpha-D-manno-heptose-7-phosphate kinase
LEGALTSLSFLIKIKQMLLASLSINIFIISVTDIPAGTGLGSSSSFAVGLLRLIRKISNLDYSDDYNIGREAINFERNILNEAGGWQDQIHAAFGGINAIEFLGNDFKVRPIELASDSLQLLNDNMYLVYTGKTRYASAIESSKTQMSKNDFLTRMVEISDEGEKLFTESQLHLKDIGNLLSEGWKLKKLLSTSVSNSALDDMYDAIICSGAYGAKLCGAGGGGFFFILASRESIDKLKSKLGAKTIITKISTSFNNDMDNIRDHL